LAEGVNEFTKKGIFVKSGFFIDFNPMNRIKRLFDMAFLGALGVLMVHGLEDFYAS